MGRCRTDRNTTRPLGQRANLKRTPTVKPLENNRDLFKEINIWNIFAYVIHEGKVRAPAGAIELIERVK